MTGTFSTDNLNKILRQNCFEVFDLPLKYEIDQNTLNNKYQGLQKQLHPDKFINHSDNLLSIKVSAHINDAYNTLKSPLLKAIAFLQQYGINLDLNIDKELPANFLMEQIELYEEIENANHDVEQLNNLAQKLVTNIQTLSDRIGHNFEGMDSQSQPGMTDMHGNGNYSSIIEDIKKMAFYSKIAKQIDEKIEETL